MLWEFFPSPELQTSSEMMGGEVEVKYRTILGVNVLESRTEVEPPAVSVKAYIYVLSWSIQRYEDRPIYVRLNRFVKENGQIDLCLDGQSRNKKTPRICYFNRKKVA